jgi:hypothetical protein
MNSLFSRAETQYLRYFSFDEKNELIADFALGGNLISFVESDTFEFATDMLSEVWSEFL